MTNEEKLRETFPNTIFIFRKNGNDETAAIMVSDEWLQGDYDQMYKDSAPCEDAVSREAVLDAIDKWVKDKSTYIAIAINEGMSLLERINALPPVTPKPLDSVLDEIRAEIEMEKQEDFPNFCIMAHNNAIERVLRIIDKYREGEKDADSD